MKKYDLHTHTKFSYDSFNKPERMVSLAKKAGLNGIAITDHNTIKGAVLVKKLNKDKNFEVIVGEEIASDCGDVVGLYLKKEIKSRKLLDVIDEIKKQGGIVFIPHPYRVYPRFGCHISKIRKKIDAIETFNSKHPVSNIIAARTARRLSLAQVGSSDGHDPSDIGRGYTVFDGDLKTAIRERKTRVGGTTIHGMISQVKDNVNIVKKRLRITAWRN